jgi:hypothetical protein
VLQPSQVFAAFLWQVLGRWHRFLEGVDAIARALGGKRALFTRVPSDSPDASALHPSCTVADCAN